MNIHLYTLTYTVFYAEATCQIGYVYMSMHPSSLDTLYLLLISLHN
ncbi:hypothetical protein BCAH1134_C0183 (plasmid) [Bacillus cereus AH1134]|nr:hypothetical protein BCAH1134_C0183 [Bacillus cereus AH1134]